MTGREGKSGTGDIVSCAESGTSINYSIQDPNEAPPPMIFFAHVKKVLSATFHTLLSIRYFDTPSAKWETLLMMGKEWILSLVGPLRKGYFTGSSFPEGLTRDQGRSR